VQVAVYELGCAAGALTVIISGDRFGRRVTVMLGESIIIVGAILQASSFGLAQMIVGRIVGPLRLLTTSSPNVLTYFDCSWLW
jgi:MFS family permease